MAGLPFLDIVGTVTSAEEEQQPQQSMMSPVQQQQMQASITTKPTLNEAPAYPGAAPSPANPSKDTAENFIQPTKTPPTEMTPEQPQTIKTGGSTTVQQTGYVSPNEVIAAETAAAEVEKKAIKQQALYDQEFNKLQAEAGDKMATQIQSWNNELQKAQDSRTQKATQFFSDYNNALENLKQLEPQQRSYWEMSDTAGKVSGILSLLGAGMVSFAQKDPTILERAGQRLNDVISRDFEQQRLKYDRAKAFLGERRLSFEGQQQTAKEYEAVLQAKRTMAIEDIKSRLDAQIAKIKDPAAQQQALIAQEKIMAGLKVTAAKERLGAAKAAAGNITNTSTFATTSPTTPKDTGLEFVKELEDLGYKTKPGTTNLTPLDRAINSAGYLRQIDIAKTEGRRAAGPLVSDFIANEMQQGSFTVDLLKKIVPDTLKNATKEKMNEWVLQNPEELISMNKLDTIREYVAGKQKVRAAALSKQIKDIYERAAKRGVSPEKIEAYMPGLDSFTGRTAAIQAKVQGSARENKPTK